MANSNIVLSAKKRKKNYEAQIMISPIPNNCHECPFYYMPILFNSIINIVIDIIDI